MTYDQISASIRMSDYFKLPNPKLHDHLQSNVKGRDEVVLTPMGKRVKPSKVLNDWVEILSQQKKSLLPSSLMNYELEMAGKVGPLSVQKPLKERESDIAEYFDGVRVNGITSIDGRALDAVINRWKRKGIGGLRRISTAKAIEVAKKSTNSGPPYHNKRSEFFNDLREWNLDGYEYTINGEKFKIAAELGWRGQEGGPNKTDTKQRVIFMFPALINILESTVYTPLTIACQRKGVIPAWVSLDAVDKCITALFDTVGDKDPIICTDFTRFDQHFNESLQSGARIVLDALFQDLDVWLDQVYPIKFNIPLVTRWGEMVSGTHGMGSGSGGTNADESIAHSLLQVESAIYHNAQLNPYSTCLGDDGILSYPGITVDDVIKNYESHGLICNPSKQYVSHNDCVYLRRWHSRGYRKGGISVGVYSTCRALGRLIYSERDVDRLGKVGLALRSLSILENVKHHPLREEFVKYCMKWDKYRFGLDIPGFFDSLLHMDEETKVLVQNSMSYTQSLDVEQGSISNINNWWIVQFLRSLG